MRIFVTGATGFVGTAIVQELLNAGHQVLGLARSEASGQKLTDAGADVHRGDLEDLDSLRSGTAKADGVIHAGFIHDFTRFPEVCQVDKIAIETIGHVLAGSNRPFIVTSGTALVSPGRLATEDIIPVFNPAWPRVSEQTADTVAALGVRAASVRLSPSVHGDADKHGFIPILVNIAKEKGVSGYIGEGLNHWNAVHRLDAARLFRLALENATPATRYHAAADEAITVKSIAEAIGKQLNLPVVSIAPEAAAAHFGWFAQMAAIDCPASSMWTQAQLSWRPGQPSLLEDIEKGIYTK
ncbi:3-beta hydroxysteroid dehydrogenase [Niastella koreensis]|uniref:NAD-dependent epimerase/dehydratase n=2 Tax=Niastella koreensis TaxID=354356 RepID=G8T7W0_NIAKG|nr:SDR family oxidoreductase [Niastella koreensis]AEV96898.1 NAD-dependent epimerase/dehydratase [Niastella koreensis GR20-10]OQP49244.1 3-beta hydroxysteroid dehydrogenase [Niastella koreensis]